MSTNTWTPGGELPEAELVTVAIRVVVAEYPNGTRASLATAWPLDDVRALGVVPGMQGTPKWSQHLRMAGAIRVGDQILGTDGIPLETGEVEAICGWLRLPAPVGLLPEDLPGATVLSVLAARPQA